MTGTEPDGDQTYQLPLAWPIDIASQAVPVNQVVCSWEANNRQMMYLILGHAGPPLLLSPEGMQQFVEQTEAYPVQPRGSFVMSHDAAVNLWEVLGRHLGLGANE